MSLETGEAVDDIRCTLADGTALRLEAKRACGNGNDLQAVVKQWAYQVDDLSPGDRMGLVTAELRGSARYLPEALRWYREGFPSRMTSDQERVLAAVRGYLPSGTSDETAERILKAAVVMTVTASSEHDEGFRSVAALLDDRVARKGLGTTAVTVMQHAFQVQAAQGGDSDVGDWHRTLREAGLAKDRDGRPGTELYGAAGVQVGSGNVQVNYFYGSPDQAGTGVKPMAPAPGVEGLPYQGHAFLSYVREDSFEVDMLQRMLEAARIPVWRDTARLWPGEDWRAKIRGAITGDALVFIACFSSRSAARQTSYQNEELLLGIDQLRRRRPDDPWLIPVRFDDCDVPDYDLGAGRTLASIQRADLFGPDRDLAAGRLVQAVQRLLG